MIRPGTLGPPCERPGIPGGGAAERERRAHRSSFFRAPRLPFFFAAMATSDLAPRRFAPPAARPCRPSHFAVSVLCRDVRLPSRFDAPRGPAAPTPRAFQGFYSLLFLLSIRCPSPRISSCGRPGSPAGGSPVGPSHAPRRSPTVVGSRSRVSARPYNPACSGLRFAALARR